MKNYDEMYQSVLSKYDEYLEKKRKRIRTFKRTAPVLACFCLTLVLGVGYWDHFKNLPHIPVQPNIIEEPTTEQSVNQTETQAPATIPPVTYTQPITDPPVQQTDSVKYEEFSRDYPYYNTVSDLAGKANQVFSGRVTNISFELLNMITMQPLKDGEDTQWAMICTIYEIEAEKVYAGSPTIVKLRIEGGISSGFEQEQTTLLGSDKIPVMEGAPVLYVGDKYLFALYHADDSEYSSILNPLQSIYTEDEVKESGFSADDIISYFQ